MSLLLGRDFLFANAVAGGLLVALVCSLLGIYVILRRMVLLGVALPQAGAAGVAAAFWLTGHVHGPGQGHAGPLAGALVATFGALALLVAGQRRGRSPAEWSIGSLLALASAATVLFVAIDPTGDLELTNLMRGELLAIGDTDLYVLAAASGLALLLFALFRREILLACFDPEFARTVGREPARADALLFLLLGSAISLGVMTAGPLVVFGFLVLPPLAALRLAPRLGLAFVLAAAVAAGASVGGFALAYHADLPAGPTSVALAGAAWLLAAGFGRLRTRGRGLRALVVLAALLLGGATLLGCATREPGRDPAPLPRGTLPDLSGRGPVVVAPFRNETGDPLRIPDPNPLSELGRAAGDPFADPGRSVPDALQAQAVQALTRRNVAARSVEEARAIYPHAPADAAAAARTAQAAALRSPVLLGTLRRFVLTENGGLLLPRLELALIDPADGSVLWRGEATRPVPVRSALTLQEVLIDAGPALFSQAFGSP